LTVRKMQQGLSNIGCPKIGWDSRVTYPGPDDSC
jgi:hypothetical protein